MAPHWTGLLLLAILALILFGGRGRISAIMGDFAKGITSFRKGLKDDEAEKEDAAATEREIEDKARADAGSPATPRSEEQTRS